MTEKRYRVLAICAHPVQYMAPILRLLAAHSSLDFQVAYCSLQGAEAFHDPEFNTTVKWDVPLLDGYAWQEVPNRGSQDAESGSFFGLYNPGIWKIIREGNFDAVLCFTGYVCATFWIAYLASNLSRSAFLFGADAWTLASMIDPKSWKVLFKRVFWPWLYSLASQVIVPSSASRDLMIALRIPPERITLTPYSVDNEWWKRESGLVDRNAVRSRWRAGAESSVILFCAKLQPWKRPMDLLRAFAKANLENALLVYAGEGPLRRQLEAEAGALGITEKVKFLGFVNQSQLPAIYTASDLMVLPSEYEAFAVVVNEASCCGCAVAASDHVGAARDLILPIHPDLIYPCGDIEALTRLLQKAVANRGELAERGQAARRHMETWSPQKNISATFEAIQLGAARVGRTVVIDSSSPSLSSSATPSSGIAKERPSR